MLVSTVKKKLLGIFLAISIALKLIIYLVDIISIYLESFLNNNKFSIYRKLLPGMDMLMQIVKVYQISNNWETLVYYIYDKIIESSENN